MSNGGDIEVRIGADHSDLDRGMDGSKRSVEKGADGMAEAMQKASNRIEEVTGGLMGRLTSLFSLGVMKGFLNDTKQAVMEAEASYRGLEAVANYAGVGIGRAMESAGRIAADGLMTTAEASKALQNLLARGYSLEQAENTLLRLKDAAAYNRSAHLSMGEAVVSATEGLKNENSILVDNAGVTKNVSKMWEEYAAKLGKSTQSLTQAEKIQAEYNGVMSETEAQVGNAAKASEGLQGQQAKLEAKTKDLMIAIGQALTPAFTTLASVGTSVINGFFKPIIWFVETLGIRAAALTTKIGILVEAVATMNFKGVGAKLNAAETLKEDMMMEALKRYESPANGFAPGVDSGRRRSDTAAALAASGKFKSGDGPTDVFGNGSFIAGDKSAADFIREQYREVNALQAEMAREGQRIVEQAARAAGEYERRSARQRIQIAQIRSESAVRDELAVVDAAQEAAHHAVEMGLMTHEELLQQQIGFEQRRNEIIMQAMNERLAMIDPMEDPVAFAQIKAEIEAAERQHQAIMTGIKNAGELERNQYALQAINGLQGGLQNAFQKMLMGQMTLAQGLKSIWQSVLSTITGVIAQVFAKWIATKIAMMILGKKSALSEISESAAKAGAGGVASMAAAPYPINLTAPFFGAAMSAMAAGFAPTASAAGGYDIPAGVNPLTQLHAREMVLPAKQANVIRKLADEDEDSAGGGKIEVHVHQNVQAWDGVDVRRALMSNQPALIDAIKNAYRNGIK